MNESYELTREVDAHFEDFLIEFDKKYDDEEKERRKVNYIRNYVLTKHQSGSSLMKLNHLADWFDEEYDSILGLEHLYSSTVEDLPDFPKNDTTLQPVNWREKQRVTAVRDNSKWINPTTGTRMKDCASSYAVATVELLEAHYAEKSG